MNVNIALNEDEQALLDFLEEYDGPSGDELGPAIESFERDNIRGRWFSQNGIGNMLYLLSRAGLVSVDINASRSRYRVVVRG